MLKGCLLFIDIMIADVREGRCASSSVGSVLVRVRTETPRAAEMSVALTRCEERRKKRKEEEEEEEEK